MTRGPQLPGLKNVFTGGGPVFPDLLERLSSRLPDSDICTVYGSTEAEPIATQRLSDLQPGDLTRMREGQGLLAGAPIKQIQLQLIEREIVVTGDHVNKSYLDGQGDAENKIHFDDMIWHRTGDAGALDEQGRLWLLGRHASRAGDFFPFMTEAIARIWPGARSAALLPKSEPPTLFIEGDVAHLDTWRRHARAIGELHVVQTDTIPMDARHHSKIDYARLKTLIGT